MGDLDTASLLFALPDGIFISSVRATPTELVVHIACRRSVLPVLSASSCQKGCMDAMGERWLTCPVPVVASS